MLWVLNKIRIDILGEKPTGRRPVATPVRCSAAAAGSEEAGVRLAESQSSPVAMSFQVCYMTS